MLGVGETETEGMSFTEHIHSAISIIGKTLHDMIKYLLQ
jgi:hypothetical protein